MTTPSSPCGRTCAPMQLWTVVRTSQGRPAASSPQSQAARLTEFSTLNGAQYCIGMRRRRRILRCVCTRTTQTGGSTWSSPHSLLPISALSSARGSRASRETAAKDSTLRISAFVGPIHLHRTSHARTCYLRARHPHLHLQPLQLRGLRPHPEAVQYQGFAQLRTLARARDSRVIGEK
jgi:hypothetical protein